MSAKWQIIEEPFLKSGYMHIYYPSHTFTDARIHLIHVKFEEKIPQSVCFMFLSVKVSMYISLIHMDFEEKIPVSGLDVLIVKVSTYISLIHMDFEEKIPVSGLDVLIVKCIMYQQQTPLLTTELKLRTLYGLQIQYKHGGK